AGRLAPVFQRIIAVKRDNRHVGPVSVAKKSCAFRLHFRSPVQTAQSLANHGLSDISMSHGRLAGSSPLPRIQENKMRVRTLVTAFGIMLSLGVASCSTSATTSTDPAAVETSQIFSDSYGKVTDSGYALPAI